MSLVALALPPLVAACSQGDAKQKKDDAKAAPAALPVTVVEVAPQQVPVTFEAVGRTEGSREVQVRARVMGILEKQLYTEGDSVQAGTGLFQIERAPFPIELATVAGNDPKALENRREMADGRPYPEAARVNFSGSTVDAATGTVQMRAEVPNPELALLPGQFVRVRVIAGTQQAIVVPQTAVLQNEGGRFVWVANAEGKAVQRPIRAGGWVGKDWILLDGLQPGEQVILDNVVRLRPGAPVANCS